MPATNLRPYARHIAVTSGGFLIPLFIVVSALYFANRREIQRAESLASDVAALRINETTEDEIERIVARYGGEAGDQAGGFCQGDVRGHSVRVDGGLLDYFGKYLGSRLFGNRIWDVNAIFNLSNGRLCYADYYLRASLPEGYSINLTGRALQSAPDFPLYSADVVRHRGMYIIKATVGPGATSEQQEHAFEFRLDCMTRIGGCKNPCEIMPAAWIDAEQQTKALGQQFPPLGYDIGCTLPSNFQAVH